NEIQPYMQRLIAMRGSDSTPNVITSLFGSSVLQGLLSGNGGKALLSIGQSLLGRGASADAHDLVGRLERGDLKVRIEPTSTFQRQFNRLETQERRTTRAVLFGSGLITSAILYTSGEPVLAAISFTF